MQDSGGAQRFDLCDICIAPPLSVSESGRRQDASYFVTIFQVIWSVFLLFFNVLFFMFFSPFMLQWLFCRFSTSTFSFEIMKKHIGFCNRLSLEPLKVGSFALLILFALFISLVHHRSPPFPRTAVPTRVYCPHKEATVPGASWNLPHERSSENIWYVNDLNLVKSCSISCLVLL